MFICLISAVYVSKNDSYKKSNSLNREDAKEAKQDKEGREKKKTQFAYIIKLRFFFNLKSRITSRAVLYLLYSFQWHELFCLSKAAALVYR